MSQWCIIHSLCLDKIGSSRDGLMRLTDLCNKLKLLWKNRDYKCFKKRDS